MTPLSLPRFFLELMTCYMQAASGVQGRFVTVSIALSALETGRLVNRRHRQVILPLMSIYFFRF